MSGWLWLAALAMTLSCSSPGFSHRAPSGMDLYPDFANREGGLIVAFEDAYSSGYYEWRAPDGELISRASFDEFSQRMWSDRLTVDDGRLLLRRRGADPTRFGVLPPADAPGPLARAVSEWLAKAGGLLGDGNYGTSQSTNARANLSCAIGADLSLAVWEFTDPNSFHVSAAGTLDPAFSYPNGLFCIKAPGGAFIVGVQGIDAARPVGQKSRMLMFDVVGGGVQEVHNFNAAHRVYPATYLATSDGLAGLEEQSDWQILSRVVLRDGTWVAEEARLAEQWEALAHSTFSWTSTHEVFLGIAARGEILRVPWAEGVSIIPYEGDVVARADTPLKRHAIEAGAIVASPSGNRLLWHDIEHGQFQIELLGAQG